MQTVKPFDARMIANQLLNHLADAVGDVAHALLEFPDEADKWTKKIKVAKNKGIQDLHGWLADELYNDPDTISDLIGDRLYDECGNDRKKQLAVIIELEKGYAGLKKACKNLRKTLPKEV